MADLYEDDILAWSERQASLLRRLAAGQSVNETPDWESIIDEVESVGRSELRACESLIVQALAHRMKAEAWPDAKLPVAPVRLRWMSYLASKGSERH